MPVLRSHLIGQEPTTSRKGENVARIMKDDFQNQITQNEALRERIETLENSTETLPKLPENLSLKRYFWLMLSQEMTRLKDLETGRGVGPMVLAELACVPEDAIPDRPEVAHTMIDSYVDYSFASYGIHPVPIWYIGEWCSSEW